MRCLISKLKKEEGSGLILALMTLMVLAVLGASLGTITIGSHRLSSVNRDSTSAYYIAEAGANQAFEEIENQIKSMYENNSYSSADSFFVAISHNEKVKAYTNGNTLNGFKSQFGDSPEATVYLMEDLTEDNSKNYTIESHGNIDNKNRVAKKSFVVTWVEDSINPEIPSIPAGAAVIAEKSINDKPNANIEGGEIINPDNWNAYLELINNFPDSNEFDKEILDSVINAEKDSVQNFKVDELDLSKISVQGDGIVNIYVHRRLLFNGSSFNSGQKPENIRIYYAGSDELNVNKDYKFNGSLFIKNADITLSHRVTFNGMLLSGGEHVFFGVHGNGDEMFETYVIAPKADIRVRNHVTINGTVIGKTVQLDNQSNISYNDTFLKNFPFNLTDSRNEKEIITSQPIIEPK